MEKKKNQFFDTLETTLKIATPIGAIVAFLIGIYHYRDSQAEEFKKTYWEKRYKMYEEISHLAGQLSHPTSKAAFDSLGHEFAVLYAGKSVLVEDTHVARAMQSFRATMKRAVYPDSLERVKAEATRISHACRLSLQETWEPVPILEIKTMDQ